MSVGLVSGLVGLLRLLGFRGPQFGLVVGFLPVQHRLGEYLRAEKKESFVDVRKHENIKKAPCAAHARTYLR